MSNLKKYILSIEANKYSYCGRPDKNKNYLLDNICFYTIKSRKNILRKTKTMDSFS